MISRRKALQAVAGASVAWPLAAVAQNAFGPTIGYLATYTEESSPSRLAAFQEGLGELGYVEGRNLRIVYRWANTRYDRLPALALELAEEAVSVILATGGQEASLAAMAASPTIPIVFIMGNDPVALGLVDSLNRPGGRLTGVNMLGSIPEPKRLELLLQLLPSVRRVGVLQSPAVNTYATNVRSLAEAASVLGVEIRVYDASAEDELDAAFAAMAADGIEAVHVGTVASFGVWRERIVDLAMRHRLPSVYGNSRNTVLIGGLMSYGVDLPTYYREAGRYVGRILNGEDPASLPVLEPRTYELIINLRTAAALGVKVPESLLLAATEVVE
ncbi:MAG: ABC transporter substrate-binding protein [Bauldia sp.]|nr:ABC transporter substrate-binding protein [Bauldia sp.]